MPCSGGGGIYALGAGEFKPQQRYREVSCVMLRGGGGHLCTDNYRYKETESGSGRTLCAGHMRVTAPKE